MVRAHLAHRDGNRAYSSLSKKPWDKSDLCPTPCWCYTAGADWPVVRNVAALAQVLRLTWLVPCSSLSCVSCSRVVLAQPVDSPPFAVNGTDTTQCQIHQTPLEEALDGDDNALIKLQYPRLREQFFDSIEAQKADIEAMVQRQLGVRACRVATREVWRSGSFNVAIPIYFPSGDRVYLRAAFPYRIGEREAPGNVEEKLRTEIATYLWLQENCPDVPIPLLHAFGLPDGSTASHLLGKLYHPCAQRLTCLVYAPS